jgi:hypothetical protein
MYIGFVPLPGHSYCRRKFEPFKFFEELFNKDRFSAAQTPHLPEFLSVQEKDDVPKP